MNIDDKEQDKIDRERYEARKHLEEIMPPRYFQRLTALDIVAKYDVMKAISKRKK